MFSMNSNSHETSSSFFEEWNSFRLPAALGFACIAFVYLRRKEPVNSMISSMDDEDDDGFDLSDCVSLEQPEFVRKNWNNLKLAFYLYCLPYSAISTLWGILNNLDIPIKAIRVGLFKLWTKAYGCNLEEMEKELTEYRNLSQFFTRELKPGSRIIDNRPSRLASPVDAKIFTYGSVPLTKKAYGDLEISQVKGLTYRVRDLLGNFDHLLSNSTKSQRKLNYMVLYLAPGDYHHFHCPHDVKFLSRQHYPGDLLPVKQFLASHIRNLYIRNERVALTGKWQQGFFGYVAVGALNVGSISIDFDEEVATNKGDKGVDQKNYKEPIVCSKGQKLGTFNLGSTIVLVFESDMSFEFTTRPEQHIKVGQSLGVVRSLEGKDSSDDVVLAPPWPGSN